MTTTDLSYPIGRFSGEQVTTSNRKRILLEIADLPGRLRDAVEGLSDAQLNTTYRPEGWTVRQVVHHLADAHLHSYIRTCFALTENEPTIMPFDENTWANLKDARSGPIEPSLLILDGVHSRWGQLLESLKEAEWEKRFVHPVRGPLTLSAHVPIYAWHGRHHTAHITELRKRQGWA
jgi:DinB superfamily